MAALRAEFKRSTLRSLYRMAQRGNPATPPPAGEPVGVSLGEMLNGFQDANFSSVQSGRVIVATAGVGRSVQFAQPEIWRTMDPETLFELAEELQQVYSDAKVTLSAQGNASPTDAQVFAVMMADDRLTTISSVQKDFSTMRWPTRL